MHAFAKYLKNNKYLEKFCQSMTKKFSFPTFNAQLFYNMLNICMNMANNFINTNE